MKGNWDTHPRRCPGRTVSLLTPARPLSPLATLQNTGKGHSDLFREWVGGLCPEPWEERGLHQGPGLPHPGLLHRTQAAAAPRGLRAWSGSEARGPWESEGGTQARVDKT